MGLIKFFKKKWNNWYYHDLDMGDEEPELDWEEENEENSLPERDAELKDANQRTVFLLQCMGQITESGERLEQYASEYEAVTSLLTDMEEIESLPNEIRVDIMNHAQKIMMLEKKRRSLFAKSGKLPEKAIKSLQAKEDEIPEGIRKMKEAEAYRKLVKYDLKKLDGERAACKYRKRELITTIANCRGVAMICGIAMVLCFIMLVVLQFSYDMDVRIGYFIAGLVGTITLTVSYLRYLDSVKEQKQLVKRVNKLISTHNTVKIRYINNTNLLAYLYQKFSVKSAADLEKQWQLYMEEEKMRHKDEALKEDLEYYYEKLTNLLRKYRIKDPDIWTRQAEALVDPREMVEVRHALIARRQKLREQMEYNQKIMDQSKERIQAVRKKYPDYEEEIDSLTRRYSRQSS